MTSLDTENTVLLLTLHRISMNYPMQFPWKNVSWGKSGQHPTAAEEWGSTSKPCHVVLSGFLWARVETALNAHPLGSPFVFLFNGQGRVRSNQWQKTLFPSTELFKVHRMQTAMSLRLFSHQCSTCFKGLIVLNRVLVQSVVATIGDEYVGQEYMLRGKVYPCVLYPERGHKD